MKRLAVTSLFLLMSCSQLFNLETQFKVTSEPSGKRFVGNVDGRSVEGITPATYTTDRQGDFDIVCAAFQKDAEGYWALKVKCDGKTKVTTAVWGMVSICSQ